MTETFKKVRKPSITADRKKEKWKYKILDWIGLTFCIFALVFVLFYAGGENETLAIWISIAFVSSFGIFRSVKSLIRKSN